MDDRLSLDDFWELLRARASAAEVEGFARLLNDLKPQVELDWRGCKKEMPGGRNRQGDSRTYWPWLKVGTGRFPPMTPRVDGRIEVPLEYIAKARVGASAQSEDTETRRELVTRLESALGVDIAANDGFSNRPTVSMECLTDVAIASLSEVFDWYASTLALVPGLSAEGRAAGPPAAQDQGGVGGSSDPVEAPRPQWFLTKEWGFTPNTFPLVGFGQDAAREKFLREARPGDWLVIAGTKGKQTGPGDRGRLLGMCRAGKPRVEVEPILAELGTPILDEHRDEQGRYRWPHGLPMLEARAFVSKPDLKEVFGDYLPGLEWATYALRLDDDRVAAIEALAWEPVALPSVPSLRAAQALSNALGAGGPSGPRPSLSRTGSERQDQGASAYVFRLQGGVVPNAFKIGFSTDVPERLKTQNKQIRPTVTGCSWELVLTQNFPAEEQAFRFEQELIDRLRDRLVPPEAEIVSIQFKRLQTAWTDVLMGKRWAQE